MSPDEVAALARPEILEALRAHADEAPDRFALRHGGRSDWPVHAMAEQLRARTTLRTKLAPWPLDRLLATARAAEQCSSLPLARFKASLVAGDGVDLCAGLGVDALHLAAVGAVTACERDPTLAAMLQHNAAALEIALAVHAGDGLDHIASLGAGSRAWIYADPDRRDADGRRQIAVAGCRPDLAANAEALRRVAPLLLVKLAPAIDATALCAQLPGLTRLLFVSHRGECKEALALCDAVAAAPTRIAAEAMLVDDDGIVLHRVVDDGAPPPPSRGPGAVVCEPDPAILRAGALAAVARAHGLAPLHPAVAYLTGDAAPSAFPGRVLQVVDAGAYRPKPLRRRLAELGITGCEIARRHFPHDPATIARQLRVTAAGRHRLLCYRAPDGDMRYVLGSVFAG